MVRRAQNGSVLIAVFWFMAVLSLAIFSTLWVVEADLQSVNQDSLSFRALQLAEMGVAIAANPVVEEFDPLLNRTYEGESGQDEGYRVRISSEGGLMNINRMLNGNDREFLGSVFEQWGMELTDAQEVVSSLIDWTDADEINTIPSLDGGAEKSYYEDELAIDNYPFDRPFYDIEEMALVRGMDLVAAYKPNWRDYFTVFSDGGVDINEASAEIITLAAEAEFEYVQDLIEQRAGLDGIEDTEDDEPIQDLQGALAQIQAPADRLDTIASRFSGNNNTVRIESTGIIGDYRKKIVLVVRNRNSRPVILMREEVPVSQ